MPGKGHRVASHQARLGQRRRRQSKEHTHVAVPSPVPDEEREGEVPASPPQPQPAPIAPRSAQRAQGEYRPTVLNYIGPELKRIGIVGGVALLALIILSIVL